MDLEYWQKNWDQLGKDDPLWAILTLPGKENRQWDPVEFFETGRTEITSVLQRLSSLGISCPGGRALDFGCGVGRLSQALAEHFAEVHGVDISPSMIEQAHRFNRYPVKCFFHQNSTSRLDLFKDEFFDFVYTNIVLAHIEPRYAKDYIREFVRVLRPDGIAVFQLPSPTFLRGLFPQSFVEWHRRRKHRGKPFIGMFGIPEREVSALVNDLNSSILYVDRERNGWRWINLTYYLVRR
jgi:2-polyprenyl-3-methyl-5-hydroxy-6-metoxy-1,4-benzoquinol methylase